MAKRQNWKDRKRDPNPANPDPPAQAKKQGARKLTGPDKPKRLPVTKARKPRTAAQKKARKARDVARSGDTQARQDQVQPNIVANALLRTTDTQEGTIHEEARRQKIRQTSETSPTERVKVEGREVEVVARPERLDPEEVPAHKRDTLIKDRLRGTDSHEDTKKADAPELVPVGGDWRTEVAKAEGKKPGRVGSA